MSIAKTKMLQNKKNYNDTLNSLYKLRSKGIKLGLSNMEKLMSTLKEPQRAFRSVHIAGTNGKGSTASIIASILIESGFRVGLYTSPHLLSFTERIRVDNHQITEDEVLTLISYIQNITEGTDIKLTFFEFATAMAFQYFASRKVDWAVVETGMGGRFDATNVIAPDISVITEIGLDHSEFLGSKISDIAFEKAGIIKSETPVVTSSYKPETIKIISGIAEKRNSELHIYEKDFMSKPVSMKEQQIIFNYTGEEKFQNLSLPLSGRHQIRNASLAVKLYEILCRQGISISEESLRRGLAKVSLEGRLEKISEHPFILLDSAHNPEASESLSASMKELFSGRKIIAIIGIMGDKDLEGIIRPLTRISETVILTGPKGERAASPEKLYDIALNIQKAGENNRTFAIKKIHSISDALTYAEKEWREESIILITGSFYTTGEAKASLGHTGVLSDLHE